MKRNIITTLLLTIFILSCSGQEPDTHSYSDSLFQATVDSLNNRISFLESILQINEVSVIADTFDFEIVDDRIKVEVTKINHDVWINIIDGDKRLNADYINYERKILLMDGVDTSASMHLK